MQLAYYALVEQLLGQIEHLLEENRRQAEIIQPLLHEQLREWDIDISVGQIDALLNGNNEAFIAEKDQLLVTGQEVSRFITVDDSGARHPGNNGYVTQIGNDWFAWFAGTDSWVHAEHLVHKLIPLNERHRQDQERVRSEIRDLYADLKAYQRDPGPTLAPALEARYDTIFTQRTSFATLIRGHVKWRKISGGTRNDLGKRCRDGFASLKKTCRKLGISFWDCLGDRIGHHGAIPPLPDIIRERAAAACAVP